MSSDSVQDWSRDFVKIHDILVKDTLTIARLVRSDSSDTWKRAYVKAVFSSMDAIIFSLKRAIKEVENTDYLPLSTRQQKRLDEFYSVRSRNGKEKKKLVRMSFVENAAFTIELYAYSAYFTYRVDRNSDQWKAIKESVTVRNRLTHPKKPSDLLVSNDEIKRVEGAYSWFQKLVHEILTRSVKNLLAQVNGLTKAKAGLTSRSS